MPLADTGDKAVGAVSLDHRLLLELVKLRLALAQPTGQGVETLLQRPATPKQGSFDKVSRSGKGN